MAQSSDSRETDPSSAAANRGSRLLRHVVVVTVPTAQPHGGSIPLLIMPDSSICTEMYDFFRAAKYRGRSGSWRRLHALAIAFLYDFQLAGPFMLPGAGGGPEALADFAERLIYGTISPDGRDPSGLFWPPQSWSRGRAYLLAARAFCGFVLERSEGAGEAGTAGDPSPHRGFADRARSINSMLGHLDDPDEWGGKGPPPLPFAGQLSADRGVTRPIAFPSSLEAPFLGTALMPEQGATRQQRHLAIRNALFFLLLMFGGLRKSEALHLFLQDIAPDPSGQGCLVFLYHPETGGIPGTGTSLRRAEYLQRHHGLVPRTRYDVTDGRWAGWKTLLLEEDGPERCRRSRVYWRNAHAGALFWSLHEIYVREVRPKDAGHPYYLTNLVGPTRGAPMTFEAADQALVTSLARLDLRPDASQGLHLHGMRHGYGQALSNAGVKPVALQVCLHHRHLASQLIYTRPSPSAVSEELERVAAGLAGKAGPVDLGRLGVHYRSDPLRIFSEPDPVIDESIIRRVVRLNSRSRKGPTS